SVKSGRSLWGRDAACSFFKDPQAAIGLFCLVKSTAPSRFFAYSGNGFEAADSSRVLIVVPLCRRCAGCFLVSVRPPVPAQPRAALPIPRKRPGVNRPAVPKAPRGLAAKVSDFESL